MIMSAHALKDSIAPRNLDRPVPVAVAAGDGIGPEITAAVCRILEAAGAGASFVPVTLGDASSGH